MIPHNKPTIGKEEEESAIRVLNSAWLSQGEEVLSFENEFCKYLGLPEGHAVALSNATSALYLSLWVLNANNKKIIFPGYACSALSNATSMIGGNEKILDITENSPNLNLKMAEKENADIIIIPHMYGIPTDLKNFEQLKIIEDCAQSLGAEIDGKKVGLHGITGVFSFYATKIITSGGQGGMFVSEDKTLVDKVRDYREFDQRHDREKRFNFQMTDLQAAIGRTQLKKLPSFLLRREEIFSKYKKAGLNLLDIPLNKTNLKPVRYRAILKTDSPKRIIDLLDQVGVKSIIPTEDWEVTGNIDQLSNSIKLTKETVSLPIYPSLTNDDVDLIISTITKK